RRYRCPRPCRLREPCRMPHLLRCRLWLRRLWRTRPASVLLPHLRQWPSLPVLPACPRPLPLRLPWPMGPAALPALLPCLSWVVLPVVAQVHRCRLPSAVVAVVVAQPALLPRYQSLSQAAGTDTAVVAAQLVHRPPYAPDT